MHVSSVTFRSRSLFRDCAIAKKSGEGRRGGRKIEGENLFVCEDDGVIFSFSPSPSWHVIVTANVFILPLEGPLGGETRPPRASVPPWTCCRSFLSLLPVVSMRRHLDPAYPRRVFPPVSTPSYGPEGSDLDSPLYAPSEDAGNSTRPHNPSHLPFGPISGPAYASPSGYPDDGSSRIDGVATSRYLHLNPNPYFTTIPSPSSASSRSESVGHHHNNSYSTSRNHGFFPLEAQQQQARFHHPEQSMALGGSSTGSYHAHPTYAGEDNRALLAGQSQFYVSDLRGLPVESGSTAVVIACGPCRGRKIRCDSNRPTCYNCVRRKNVCIYDSAPRRRGPDKHPGTRQRSCKKRPVDGSLPPPKKPKVSPADEANAAMRSAAPHASAPSTSFLAPPPPRPPPPPPSQLRISTDLQPYSRSSSLSSQSQLFSPRQASSRTSSSVRDPRSQSPAPAPHAFFPSPSAPAPSVQLPAPSVPGLERDQRRWWNEFLDIYPLNQIVDDLSYLFADAGHWLCFVNATVYIDYLWHPESRLKMQPAFVLAGLALAELMRASDVERGAGGRGWAGCLRDHAQSALALAMSARVESLDPSLAEAALILVLYETSAHPLYHPDRVAAALQVLDQLLLAISAFTVDSGEGGAAKFAENAVPIVPGSAAAAPCSSDHALRWDPTWSPPDMWKESARRLTWSALSLATSYLVQCVAFDREVPALEMTNPANYALLFPGEISDRSKESPWALYCRSLLLWNFLVRLLAQAPIDADALHETWNETLAVQDSLEAHSCHSETSISYLCQEYIHNIRTSVAGAIRRSAIPSLASLKPSQKAHRMNGFSRDPPFNRSQTAEWGGAVEYQSRVIALVKSATFQLSGPQGYPLTRRPFQVSWFLNQLHLCLQILTHDPHFLGAMQLGKDLLGVVEVLNALWPCKLNSDQARALRSQLTQMAVRAGLSSPLPPSYAATLVRL
ncbi:unnamed protein product [Mycena citricolor]|uniref:Zn(2)-C6 fungal-type domain-containing protein n=1 Tax=Mycena citricolor TaxID=2018698 RepID=A0AAD2K866_9AGAR|nr:unnamed protein product [Mycena citricolor]